MKKMKKVLTLVMCVITVLAIAAGCGSSSKYADSKYTGEWKATTGEYMGIEIAMSDVFDTDVILTLDASGEASFTADGETQTGTWEETDDGVVLDGYDEIEVTSSEDGQLTIDYSGVTINFEKQ